MIEYVVTGLVESDGWQRVACGPSEPTMVTVVTTPELFREAEACGATVAFQLSQVPLVAESELGSFVCASVMLDVELEMPGLREERSTVIGET